GPRAASSIPKYLSECPRRIQFRSRPRPWTLPYIVQRQRRKLQAPGISFQDSQSGRASGVPSEPYVAELATSRTGTSKKIWNVSERASSPQTLPQLPSASPHLIRPSSFCHGWHSLDGVNSVCDSGSSVHLWP